MRPTDRSLQPIDASDRIVVLDVLRGFALLGILLMNIEGFVGPLDAAMTGLDPALRGADRIADALVYIFVQGKFYTLFCLLFGMGFAVLAQRTRQAGRALGWLYLRRTLGLLLIGLLHATLLWSGDVLTSYALLAMALLLFLEAPTRSLPWLALAVWMLGPLYLLASGAMASLMQADPASAAQWHVQAARIAAAAAQELQQQRQAFGPGSGYAAATAQRLRDLGSMLHELPFNAPAMLGMFVLGSWFLRAGVIAAPQRHARLFALLRWLSWPLGLAVMLVSFHIDPWMDPARLDLRLAAAAALASLAGLLMCLGYLGWVVRCADALRWLAPAGRMALTNYVMQSLVCTTLFYGYGLGWFEALPRAWQLPFALALFAVQVVLSGWWLARFRFGPLEWLWRWGTYLRRPVMRRAMPPSA